MVGGFLANIPSIETTISKEDTMSVSPPYETNKNDENEKKSKKIKYLSGALITVFTAAAYLTGLGYYQGVLAAYGISSDAFPLPTTDIYVHTYFAIGYIILGTGEISMKILTWCLNPPGAFWATGALVISSIIIYAGLKIKDLKPHIPNKRKILLNKIINYLKPKNNKYTQAIAILFLSSYLAYLILFGILICGIGWWILPVAAYKKGYDNEIKKVNAFRKLGCTKDEMTTWDKCFTVQDETGKVIHEGILVALSSKEIAIFEKSGSFIFARKDGYTIKRKLH